MTYEQLERCYKSALEQRDKAECKVVELENEIDKLHIINKNMHTCVSGYLKDKEWQHWQQFNEPRFILK
jgi:hypothetical protein